MTFSVTFASKEHLAAIGPIELAAATMFSEADLPADIRFRVTDQKSLREAQKDGRIWVALTGVGVPVGFAMVALVDDVAHLDELGVLPNYSRCGIGTKLVNAVSGWARDSGFSALTLITFKHLPWNAPFYEKLGFIQLRSTELDSGLAGLIQEEGRVGIDISKRIGMKLKLRDDKRM